MWQCFGGTRLAEGSPFGEKSSFGERYFVICYCFLYHLEEKGLLGDWFVLLWVGLFFHRCFHKTLLLVYASGFFKTLVLSDLHHSSSGFCTQRNPKKKSKKNTGPEITKLPCFLEAQEGVPFLSLPSSCPVFFSAKPRWSPLAVAAVPKPSPLLDCGVLTGGVFDVAKLMFFLIVFGCFGFCCDFVGGIWLLFIYLFWLIFWCFGGIVLGSLFFLFIAASWVLWLFRFLF